MRPVSCIIRRVHLMCDDGCFICVFIRFNVLNSTFIFNFHVIDVRCLWTNLRTMTCFLMTVPRGNTIGYSEWVGEGGGWTFNSEFWSFRRRISVTCTSTNAIIYFSTVCQMAALWLLHGMRLWKTSATQRPMPFVFLLHRLLRCDGDDAGTNLHHAISYKFHCLLCACCMFLSCSADCNVFFDVRHGC